MHAYSQIKDLGNCTQSLSTVISSFVEEKKMALTLKVTVTVKTLSKCLPQSLAQNKPLNYVSCSHYHHHLNFCHVI